jgi:2-keto-4-pentenoate hydratase/2-oxohepta-3-ene-1,7-dioic acid hydratase in catechol pathway
MKLFRALTALGITPGLIDAQGQSRSLKAHLTDITPDTLSTESLAKIEQLDAQSLPRMEGTLHYLPPINGTRQIIAAGLNYRQHALESGMAIPAEPILFSKAITSLSGANDDIVLPRDSIATDYEAELAVIIGRDTYDIALSQALQHVAGYCVANDVSERDYQLKRGGGQWLKGKSSPSFTPLGPWLVTSDEVPNPQALDIKLSVNGQLRQHCSTADMIFSVAELVAHASQFMRLLPGDVLLTGTPQGVGMGLKPPNYLRKGDSLLVSIGNLGEQRQSVT